MTLNLSEYCTKVDVRPDDIDLFGHVHSAKYLDYFLAARFDQMDRCYGCSMTEFLEKGLGWYMIDFQISYKRPLKLADSVHVFTKIESLESQSITLRFKMKHANTGKLVSEGMGKFTLVTISTGRAIVIPDWVIQRYSVVPEE